MSKKRRLGILIVLMFVLIVCIFGGNVRTVEGKGRVKKILYVPLDERPCNYDFPQLICNISDEYKLITVPKELMGDKKVPADVDKIWKWVFENVSQCDGAILSIDTLVYGGIVPSRLHNLSKNECKRRLENLNKIKKINNKIKIFGFNLIMRCPQYSSKDEEPNYYAMCGREIFLKEYLAHKKELGIITKSELIQLNVVNETLPTKYFKDYMSRREVNREVNRMTLDYVEDGTIDFMVIPQDDSAPYGVTAKDQQYVRSCIRDKDLELKVYMYPGADEVASILLARYINQDKNKTPLIYVKYSSVKGPITIPKYEDRYLHESIKYQILAAGALLSDSLNESDMVLLINSPGEEMIEADNQNKFNVENEVYRNIIELVEYANYCTEALEIPIVIGDIAYINGGDLQLLKLLREKDLLYKINGYAGWNTSSNSLGTCISQGIISSTYGLNENHKNFLALRYLDDCGYSSYTRKYVCDNYLKSLGCTYSLTDGKRGEVSLIVKKRLEEFVEKYLNSPGNIIEIDDVYMPWNRMGEVGLKVKVQ